MIKIDSGTKINEGSLNKLLEIFRANNIKLNIETIDYDINKLINKKDKDKDNKVYNINKGLIVNYLKGLKDIAVKNSQLGLRFFIENRKIKSIPFETKKIDYFDIETTDYIENNKIIINIDYSKLMDNIAFEMGYRDFSFEHNALEIEELLKDVSIIGVNDGKVVNDIRLDWVGNDRIYNYYKCLIANTRYRTLNKKNYTDYYGNVIVNDLEYRGVLESTMNYTMCIIVYSILNELYEENIKDIKLLAVYDSSLVLMADSSKYNNIAAIHRAVCVRLFGRYFKFLPEVKIY